MTFSNFSKLLSRSLIGAVGLGAISVLSLSEVTKAQDVPAGSDFFISPSGLSTFIFDTDKLNAQLGLGLPPGQEVPIPLKGVAITPELSNTDTVVTRLDDCTFVGGECTVDIEMVGLSLISVDPLNIPGFGEYNINAILDPQNPTLGEMTINEDGTFSSFLDVFYAVSFEPIGNAQPLDDFFDNLLLTNRTANWTPEPPSNAVCVVQGFCAGNQFFPVGLVEHEKGSPTFPEGHTTILEPVDMEKVPEPSVTATLVLFGLAGLRNVKKRQSAN